MTTDSDITKITPRALTDEELLVIGRIVRASADVEDCLNLWISKLLRCDEAGSAVILGRSNIATKLTIAAGLAKLHGGNAPKLHDEAFDERIDQLLSCRNAVAHGAFAGETDTGWMAFVTNVNTDYSEASLARRADCFTLGNLKIIAHGAERRVGQLDAILGLGALRKKRLWQEAPVRPKRPPKGKKGAQPKPQRGASRG